MKIPPDEIERLNACVHDAWDLADQGRVEEGYRVLDVGLMRAETPALNPVTWEEIPPDPWAVELIAHYRQELERFVASHRRAAGYRSVKRRAQILQEAAGELRAIVKSLGADPAQSKECDTQFVRGAPDGPAPGKPN